MITFREYESKPRRQLGGRRCARLQALDERLATHAGDTIFDWSRRKVVRAKNYVGVLQDGDFSVEVLPKTDVDDRGARKNLLYMMGLAGRLPIRDRDLASLRIEHLPLGEALIALFAERLLAELRRGMEHQYVVREENSGFVRGKIVLPIHIKKNAAHQERVYVAYDEFLADTWLNRVLKAACRLLVRRVRNPVTQRNLKEAVLIFADVADLRIARHHLSRIRLTRNSERFADVYAFAKLVLLDRSPAPQSGDTRSFSLLVRMDALFEEFIGHLVRRHALELGFPRERVKLQARGNQRFLLKEAGENRLYRLKPDVLVRGEADSVWRVLDTKWKRLDTKSSRKPSEADMYQLYAYASRYESPLSVLLYPKMPGLSARDYQLDGDDKGRRVRVAFVDMSRDLRAERGQLVEELRLALA